MAHLTAFSDRDITTRDRLEDYATDDMVTTAVGLSLQLAMVCGGAIEQIIGFNLFPLFYKPFYGLLDWGDHLTWLHPLYGCGKRLSS